MYRRVGSTNIPQSSSPEKQVNSVRKLYRELDNKTVVYPGHGRSTDIGSEKIHNSEVTEESVNLKD